MERGGAILTWDDRRSGQSRIFAQRLDHLGVPQWQLDGVEVGGLTGEQHFPALCPDGAGGAFVVWRELSVRVQHLSAAGDRLWGPDGVEVSTRQGAFPPSVAMDDSGGAIVAWHALVPSVNRIDASGARRWGDTGVELAASGQSSPFSAPVIVKDGSGGALVWWRGASLGSVVQRLGSDGVPMWGAGGVAALAGAGGFYPYRGAMVSDGAGGAIVAASGRVQHVDATGQLVWGASGVALTPSPNGLDFSAAVADGAGGAIVAWGGLVQRVSADGVPQWPGGGVRMSQWPRDPGDSIVEGGGGGAILAWKDYRASFDGSPDVYAQELGTDGTELWTRGGVPVFLAAGQRREPVCVADGQGNVVNVWVEKRGGYLKIVARKNSGANQPMWPPVECADAVGSQAAPLAIPDGAGGTVVAWMDSRALPAQWFAQHLDASGARLWTDGGTRIDAGSGTTTPIGIVPDGTGGLVAAWTNDAFEVRLKRIDGDGTRRWAPDGVGQVIVDALFGAHSLASDGSGGAVLVWRENTSSSFLRAQRVDGTGLPRWGLGGAPVSQVNSSKNEIVVVPDDSAGVVVAWSESELGRNRLYAQAVDSSGVTRWRTDGVPLLISAVSLGAGNLRSIPDGAGGAVISWGDLRLDPNNFSQGGIFLQRIDHSGTLRWSTEGVPVRASPFRFTENATLIPDGSGGAIAAWAEGFSITSELYAQRVDGGGNVAWAQPSPVCLFPRGSRLLTGSAIDAAGGGFFAWQDSRDSTHDDVYALRLTSTGELAAGWSTGGVTATVASLVLAEARSDAVRLVWQLSAPETDFRIERSHPGEGWVTIGRAELDGLRRITFTDRDVRPGESIGYRIRFGTGGNAMTTGETWVSVPSLALALVGARPNPASGDRLRILFTLPSDHRATIELFDVCGRSLESREVGGLGVGEHAIILESRPRRPQGLYLVRLWQEGRDLVARVLVLH